MHWTHNGYLIRPSRLEDAEDYYHSLFSPLDPEAARLTGSPYHFPKETVLSFFKRCIADETRHDFLILDPSGCIIGESVINEYDPQTNSANYRIFLSGSHNRDRGIGTWAVRTACAFAFEEINLTRLTLSVYDFNPRAIHVYEKCGFESIGREDNELLMELTHHKWLSRR